MARSVNEKVCSVEKQNVLMVADMDLSKTSGEVIRTIALATELQKKLKVTLLAPEPKNSVKFELNRINTVYVPVKNEGGSVLNIYKRTRALINEAKKISKGNILIIETTPVAGYFALAGFSGYVVDVHGIYFSELDYANSPWFVPKKPYKIFTKYLERSALKKAGRINTVSKTMMNFINTEFNAPKNKIELISNGFFEDKVLNTEKKKIKEIKGRVAFVGNLAKWANVDKIINAANILRDENVTFYIIGDGIYRQGVEGLIKKYKLSNVILTGYKPLDEAYEIIAQSQIMLLPFPKDICTEIACPIKVLEYMAFGKAMVIDEVDDVSKLLKKNNAALVCDPDNEEDFAESILFLLNNEKIRKEIGNNARLLSKEFSWKTQGQKLVEVLENING